MVKIVRMSKIGNKTEGSDLSHRWDCSPEKNLFIIPLKRLSAAWTGPSPTISRRMERSKSVEQEEDIIYRARHAAEAVCISPHSFLKRFFPHRKLINEPFHCNRYGKQKFKEETI